MLGWQRLALTEMSMSRTITLHSELSSTGTETMKLVADYLQHKISFSCKMPVCLWLPYISYFIPVLIAGTTRPSSSIPSGHSTLGLSISSWVHDMPSLFFLNSVQITLSLAICHHPSFLNDPTTIIKSIKDQLISNLSLNIREVILYCHCSEIYTHTFTYIH